MRLAAERLADEMARADRAEFEVGQLLERNARLVAALRHADDLLVLAQRRLAARQVAPAVPPTRPIPVLEVHG